MLYLIQAGNRIKIGIAANPHSRFRVISNASPEKCRLALTVATMNDKEAEAVLHRYFKDHRVNGEWFEINLATAFRAVIDLKLFPEHDQPTLQIPIEPVPPLHPDFGRWFIARLPYDTSQDEIENVRMHVQDHWNVMHEEFLSRLMLFSDVEDMIAGDRTMSWEEASDFFDEVRGRLQSGK